MIKNLTGRKPYNSIPTEELKLYPGMRVHLHPFEHYHYINGDYTLNDEFYDKKSIYHDNQMPTIVGGMVEFCGRDVEIGYTYGDHDLFSIDGTGFIWSKYDIEYVCD